MRNLVTSLVLLPPLASALVRLWPASWQCINTLPKNSNAFAKKLAARFRRKTQAAMGVELTVRVNLAPITSSPAKTTTKNASPKCRAMLGPRAFKMR